MCPTISGERWRSVGIRSFFYGIASDIVTMTYQRAPTPATVTVSLAQLSFCSNRTSHITFYIFCSELFYLFLLNFLLVKIRAKLFSQGTTKQKDLKSICNCFSLTQQSCQHGSLMIWGRETICGMGYLSTWQGLTLHNICLAVHTYRREKGRHTLSSLRHFPEVAHISSARNYSMWCLCIVLEIPLQVIKKVGVCGNTSSNF